MAPEEHTLSERTKVEIGFAWKVAGAVLVLLSQLIWLRDLDKRQSEHFAESVAVHKALRAELDAQRDRLTTEERHSAVQDERYLTITSLLRKLERTLDDATVYVKRKK